MKLKIKKGDIVQVITGNDKGKTGRVLIVYPKKMKILVEGVNLRTKHTKPNPRNQKGGRIEQEIPIDYSNVMIIDSDKKPTRIGMHQIEKGNKVVRTRYAISNGNDL